MKAIATLLAALALAACTPQPTASPEAETLIIPFTVLDEGVQSGIHPDTHTLTLIQDNKAWQSLWSQHKTITPIPSAPHIDFATQNLITVIDSDQPNSGYTLHMDKVEQHGDELWVYVTREQPASACLNMGMVSQPYVFATIPKGPVKTKLLFSTHMYEC
jgi:hypothetical protein